MSNQHMHNQGKNLPNHEDNIGEISYLPVNNSYVFVCVCDEVQVHKPVFFQARHHANLKTHLRRPFMILHHQKQGYNII
jgi:hypothetical protein